MDFYTSLGKAGTLFYDGERLCFEGDADASAAAFFEALNHMLTEHLKEAYIAGYEDALREKSVDC
jgi:hypothetical protein